MNEIKEYTKNLFEDIKHIDEYANEYWEARELQKVLEYKEWRNFNKVLDKAIKACLLSNIKVSDHFVEVNKMVKTGDSYRKIKDYKLSRYACYLIVQNGESTKEIIALGQTYFAVQTKKQELIESEYDLLTEDEKRIYQRNLTRKGNFSLNQTAKKSGVKNFDKFHNSGYKGFYGGETADNIARRKHLRYREDILDNMGSKELAINLFRITQTESKLKRENVNNEKVVNKTHFDMGKDIRDFIKKQGGNMPEELPIPNKSIKEIEYTNVSVKELK